MLTPDLAERIDTLGLGLWQTGWYRLGTTGYEVEPEPVATRLAQAHAALGFEVLVVLTDEVPDVPAGVTVIHCPINDNPFGLSRLEQTRVAQAVRDALRFRGIMTMCQAGMNRSGLFSALVLIYRDRWPAEQAVAHVRQQAHGGSGNALFNRGFVRFLLQLGEYDVHLDDW